MDLTRRRFLRLSGLSALGAVVFTGCVPVEGFREELLLQSPAEIPEDTVAGGELWFATLCRRCPAPEGIIVRVMEGRAKKVEGNPEYPVNLGKHSARCEAALQELYHPDRITQPLRSVGARGSGNYQPISWDEALNTLTSRLADLRNAGNAGGMLLITDPLRGHLGGVVDRFVSTYGGRHMAFEPLERVVLRRAIQDVYGQARLPHFDIRNTAYLLSFGADVLGTWVSPVSHAVAYGEFRQGEDHDRGTFVQVDPRFSTTAASADEWVPIRPGAEGLLAWSIAYVLIEDGLADADAADALTSGQGASWLEAYAPGQVADATGVSAERIRRLAHDFAEHAPALAVGGDSAAAQTNGLFNLKAIYSLNYLVGSVGSPGGVIFNPASPFTDAPDARGGAPLSDWQGVVDSLRGGQTSVVLTRGANPVHGLPASLGFRDALGGAEFVASFASVLDDTAAMADLILPEHAAMETWGNDIPDPGPGYQVVGFQQPVVRPAHDTRAFGDVMLAIAPEIGEDVGEAVPWNTMQDVLKDAARQLFELNRGWLTAPTFDSFWNRMLAAGGWWDEAATANTPPPQPAPAPRQPATAAFVGEGRRYHLLPFRSIGLLDGRNAHLPWLQATPDPTTTGVWRTWVEINLRTAEELDLAEGEVVELSSPVGTIEGIVYPTPAAPPDILSIPLGQGHEFGGRYAKQRGSNPLAALAPQADAETGAFAWAATKVDLRKTGRRTRMVKFEGFVTPTRELEEIQVVQVTRG